MVIKYISTFVPLEHVASLNSLTTDNSV